MYELIAAIFIVCGPAYMLLGVWVGRRAKASEEPVLIGPSYEQWRASADNVISSLQEVEKLTTDLRESRQSGSATASELVLASLATVQNRLELATSTIQRALDPTLTLSSIADGDGNSTSGDGDNPATAASSSASPAERRRTSRISYLAHQFVAANDVGRPLLGEHFQRVQCNNLSPTGIAFIVRSALPRSVVVSLGCAASRMFMVARVVYQYPLRPREGFGYMVGCEFIRRLEEKPVGWTEPDTAAEPAAI